MTRIVVDSLVSQFEATLAMVRRCVVACPSDAFDDKVGNDTFRQVVYHTLFYFDFYLAAGETAFRLRDLHRKGGDERGAEAAVGLSQEDALVLVSLCREQIAFTLGAETAESLAGASGFSRRRVARVELHMYNIRHAQHHVGQLSAFLRRLGPRVAADAIPWIGEGWK